MDLDFASEPQLDELDAPYCPYPIDLDWAREDLAEKGLRRDDQPVQPCQTLADPPGMTVVLGLPVCANALVNAGIWAIAANLISLEQIGEAQWTFYSRDNTHYSRVRWYVCLLYTSPSPRDRQKSRMPSSA